MLVLATLGAPERRRRILRRKRRRPATTEPEPTPVTTGRATIIDVDEPLVGDDQAKLWLRDAGEEDLRGALEVLNRGLHAFRLVSADSYLHEVTREQALVARIGYGEGEQVADGHWAQANELMTVTRRQKRSAILAPQARLAAILNGREQALACQELVLRARLDLDQGRYREGALQLLVTLDAALAELPIDEAGPALPKRLAELRERRDAVAQAAQAALAGPLDEASIEVVAFTLGRIEAALRARAMVLA